MVQQHRQILQSMLAGNWARARRLLSEHIRAQGPILMNLLARETAAGARTGARRRGGRR